MRRQSIGQFFLRRDEQRFRIHREGDIKTVIDSAAKCRRNCERQIEQGKGRYGGQLAILQRRERRVCGGLPPVRWLADIVAGVSPSTGDCRAQPKTDPELYIRA